MIYTLFELPTIKKINKKEKVTVILTTHDMQDIASLAKRIILIGKGKLLYDGSLENLKNKYDYYRKVTIITKDKIHIDKDYIVSETINKDNIEFILDIRKVELSDFIKYISSKISLIDIDVDNQNIDDLIVRLYEEYKI